MSIHSQKNKQDVTRKSQSVGVNEGVPTRQSIQIMRGNFRWGLNSEVVTFLTRLSAQKWWKIAGWQPSWFVQSSLIGWSGLNPLLVFIIRKKSDNTVTWSLKNDDGDLISEPLEVCNVFNNYFANIGSKLAEQLPESNTSFESYIPSSSPCTNFTFDQVESSEVVKEIYSRQTIKGFWPWPDLNQVY